MSTIEPGRERRGGGDETASYFPVCVLFSNDQQAGKLFQFLGHPSFIIQKNNRLQQLLSSEALFNPRALQRAPVPHVELVRSQGENLLNRAIYFIDVVSEVLVIR
jgi:hypothetical protein